MNDIKKSWFNFTPPCYVPVCKMGYSRNIPYPEIFEKMYVPVLKWDIPYPRISEELHVPLFLGISHIPIFFKKGMYQFFFFFGISHIPNFQEKICTVLFWDIQSTDISDFFIKLCTSVCSAVLSCPIQLPKLIHS